MVLAAGQQQRRTGPCRSPRPPPAAARAPRTPARSRSTVTPGGARPRDRGRPAARRRRRSSRWPRRRRRLRPCAVRDLGHPLRLDHRPRRAEAAAAARPVPAAAQPVRPTRATTWSGPAPDRRTGRRPSRAPNTVTAMVMSRDRVTSPPTSTTPDRSPSARSPAANSSAQASGRSPGAEKPDHHARTPAAHRLDVGDVDRDRLAADLGRARTSRGGSAPPRPARRSRSAPGRRRQSTAASSPGPTRISGEAGRSAVIAGDQGELPDSPRVGPVGGSEPIRTTVRPVSAAAGCTPVA